MAVIDTADMISVTEAGKRGVSALVKTAEQGGQCVLMRNNKPVAALVSIESLERAGQVEEQLLDVALSLTRLLTTNERRHSLDDILDRLGYTREALEEE